MRHWTKSLFALAAPLLLNGCLWTPGKFVSDLTLRRDGGFVLDYRGEIILETSASEASQPWRDTMASCATDAGTKRPCKASEIADQRGAYEKKRASDQEMAKSLGFPGADDESNRAFAAKLMKYAGWRSVDYRGKGVFDVDYHFEGRLTQDFAFPLMPENSLLIPFVALRRRTDGSVLVNAPGLTGGADLFGPIAQQMGGQGKQAPPSHAQGRFTIHTDGQVLTNNSEDGPAADPVGQQLHWDIAPGSSKAPEALIRVQ